MPEAHEPTIKELFDLTGRAALVTGGTGWLGTSFSRALAEAGATVIISSRDPSRAQKTASTLPSPGGAEHFGVELDHMDEESLKGGFLKAEALTGKIDILVNNGLEAVGKDLTNISMDEFARHQRNNAAYFVLARLVRDSAVRNQSPASVINIGSMYGQVASYPDAYEGICAASPVAYHSLKGGTIHMTRHLAVYWAKDHVRVNCLSPGPFPNTSKVPDGLCERLDTKLPMQRMGLPYELKGALLLLASDAGSYITGQNITVDGGWTAW
ncbi:MAG: SDR family oxidoreductase [Planctomycetota bacterium]|nr:SDR family oxidoreductase [Planctomycetota bacterium]MDA1137133.1 SDR family oxidoreductase [Planctomycetota bacterium]